MKIVVHAYQRYGKPAKKPDVMTFCCWQSLYAWLNKHPVLYGCDECKKKGGSKCQGQSRLDSVHIES